MFQVCFCDVFRDICKLEKEENDFIKTDNLKTNSLYNGVCKECIEELKKHALEVIVTGKQIGRAHV